MNVPDAIYTQTGLYHEFYQPREGGVPSIWLEVHLTEYGSAFYLPPSDGNLLRLNLSDTKILRDILTEHIARQERGNPA